MVYICGSIGKNYQKYTFANIFVNFYSFCLYDRWIFDLCKLLSASIFLRCIFLFACLGYARFYTPPKSHVWPFTKFIEFSRGCHRPWKIEKITTFEERFWIETRHGWFEKRCLSWILCTKVWNKSHWFQTQCSFDSKQWGHASFGTTGHNWAIETQRLKSTNGWELS